MDAAMSLTALGDEESSSMEAKGPETSLVSNNAATNALEQKKRYLPDHKKPDAAPTFPEKMMALMQYAETKGDDFCVTWLADGKSFIIKDMDEFTRSVVPKFFKPTKFSSFTRKLYRWGFRQINRGIGHDDPVIFGNEHFQKGNPELMTKMKSTTAAATRKQDEISQQGNAMLPSFQQGGIKRTLDDMMAPIEMQQQLLLSELLRAKKGRFNEQGSLSNPTPFFGNHFSQQQASQAQFGSAANTSLSLQNMMRPNMNMGGGAQQQQQHSQMMGGNKSFGSIMSQGRQNDSSLLGQFLTNSNGGNGGFGGAAPTRPPALANNFPPNSTTADIVNAAIEALRYG